MDYKEGDKVSVFMDEKKISGSLLDEMRKSDNCFLVTQVGKDLVEIEGLVTENLWVIEKEFLRLRCAGLFEI